MKDTAVQIQEFLIDARRTARREMIACWAILPFFAFCTLVSRPGSREFVGYFLLALAALFELAMMFFVLRPRGDLYSHPPEDVAHWTSEIRRQAKLRRWVPLWYLGPVMPGLLVLLWSLSADLWMPTILWGVIAFFALVTWLNVKAARGLEQTAATLGEPPKSGGAPQSVYPAARMSLSIRIITTSILAMTAGFLIGGLFYRPVLSAGALLGIVSFLCYAYAPKAYDISNGRFTVQLHAGKKDFGLVTACRRIAPPVSGTIRLFGNGGLFAGAGIFWNKQYGVFRAYLTSARPQDAVLVETKSHKVVITPEDPEAFVKSLQTAAPPT
jgi:hypothetical protein